MITKNFVQAKIKSESRGLFSLEVTDAEGKKKVYEDLTGDFLALVHFTNMINEGNVSPLHIEDMIEDFLP